MAPEGQAQQRRGGIVLVELIRLVVVVICTGLGYQVSRAIVDDAESTRILVGTLLGSSIGYVVGGMLGRAVGTAIGVAESRLAAMSGAELVAGGAGMTLGVIVGTAAGLPLLLLPSRAVGLPMLAFMQIVLGYLGFRAGLSKREDVLQLFGLTHRTRAADLRVLDTSAILNPQLLDFVRVGLLRGVLLVPSFVLEEAQGWADSTDPIRRPRARRGLDSLAAVRREGLAEVRPVEKTYPEFDEVDAKVTALARERGAALVTDDAALARIAEIQGIEVIHLRRIAQALRPSALPGEAIELELVREGTEPDQGVGYLDDGTMVVVHGAGALVGTRVEAIVSRVIQTSGGRMLFARLDDQSEDAPQQEAT